MFDGIVAGEGLGLLKAAGVDGGEFIFAGFMGGIDKLLGYQFVPTTAKRIINVDELRKRDLSSL